MKIFEGKSPEERNKTIAALVLGSMALLAIGYNIIGFFPGGKTTVKVTASPTPKKANARNGNAQNVQLPPQEDVNFLYSTTPVVYNPGILYGASEPGRNIFAFYEPGLPTPYSPTPVPELTPTPFVPPTPTPTPLIYANYASPQSVYAGSKSFRLEINGERFRPDMIILFNGTRLPTTYISPERLVAEVPANLIATDGAKQIIIVSPDGSLFSNQITLNVQAPPKPTFQYIGMIARKRYNNDTAYFQEQGKQDPVGARLNDVVAGRFRVKSISAEEVVLEDITLGFRHNLALYRPPPGQNTDGRPSVGSGIQYNPNTRINQQDIPGIPNNIPRYQPTPVQTPQQDDVDDDGN